LEISTPATKITLGSGISTGSIYPFILYYSFYIFHCPQHPKALTIIR
jgi:hypothetical protein